MAARIQAEELYGVDVQERMRAADAVNRTATTASPKKESPDELFYGEVPQIKRLPLARVL